MQNYIKPYYNEDKSQIGVLVSRGYGSGWSTYNVPELCYDKRVIEYWMTHNTAEWVNGIYSYDTDNPYYKAANDFFESIGYKDVNFFGYNGIELQWVPCGMPFVIEEYDGAEYIMQRSDFKWMVLY